MRKYYYSSDGVDRVGPVTLAELESSGDLTSETLIWYVGLPSWVRAVELPELSELFITIPPPIVTGSKSSDEYVSDSPQATDWEGWDWIGMIVAAIIAIYFLCQPSHWFRSLIIGAMSMFIVFLLLEKLSKFKPYHFLIFAVIVLCLTLPFHYVPSRLLVFPKDHLTFENTFVFPSDLKKIQKRFHEASLLEKLSISQEPFVKKLIERTLEDEDFRDYNRESE
jgi:hypothetical protein